MNGKLLGVVGGLGPRATAHFTELTARMTDMPRKKETVDMIVCDFPAIPDSTGYLQGSNLRSPLPGLLWVGRTLARQKVDCIAMPCITAHFFCDALEEDIRTPVINAVAETARHLKEHGVASAGVMATDGTLISGLFSQALLATGIRPVLPSRQRQADVMRLIYENIRAGKPPQMDRFYTAEEELRKKGAEVIILGCTELSLLKKEQPVGTGFLDAMEVLARLSILRCGRELKKEYGCLIT